MKENTGRLRRVAAALPPLEEVLRGTVFERRLRCGKPGCHCAAGEGHRATYLSVTLPGGRTEQLSLPAALVPLAKRWVANYRRWWAAVERISALNRDRLRRERAALGAERRAPSRRRPRDRGG